MIRGKKMKKVLIVLTALLLIAPAAGCSKKVSWVCEMEEASITSTNLMEATGDKVTFLTYDTFMSMSGNNVNESIMQASVDEIIDDYNSTAGVEYTYDIDGDDFHQIVQIDLTQAKISDLAKLGIMADNGTNATSISLKMTVANMEAGGFSCHEVNQSEKR